MSRPPVLLAVADGFLFCEMAQALAAEGYPVESVRTGHQALERLLEQSAPRIAVLHRHLRGVGGAEVIDRLREQSSLTFCVLLDDTLALSRADQVLGPPYDPQRLLAMLAAAPRERIIPQRSGVVHLRKAKSTAEDVNPATGVWNRVDAEKHIGEAFQRMAQRRGCVGVVRIKINGLTEVERRYGGLMRRRALQACTKLIRTRTRGDEGIGLISRSEFLVVTHGDDPNGPSHVADRVQRAFKGTPLQLDERELDLSVTIGVALAWKVGPPEMLLRAAGRALRNAQQAEGVCALATTSDRSSVQV